MKQNKFIDIGKKTVLSVVASLVMANSAFAVDNKVYAVVNGDKITAQSIAVALKDPRIKFNTLPTNTQKNILDKLVEQKLLSQNALKTDVVNEEVYKTTLKSLSQDLALQVWMQKESKSINVDDKELEEFYNKNKKLFNQPMRLNANHILVKTEVEAKTIIEELNKAKDLKAKFIELAKSKSVGPSGKNGGSLDWFSLDKMVPEFSNAAKILKKDSISKTPVKTQFGFHIIYLADKEDAKLISYKEAKQQIKQKLGQDKFIEKIQKVADKLKAKAKIEYK
ncbi:MAG: peptidylprolyl isomerase [Campylobacterota bacterium]|nr:peptidylprolyl isomerase [Campylobacterota bacterium]